MQNMEKSLKEWGRGKVENPNNIKRSIRIPKELHEELEEIARYREISVNKLILEILRRGIR